jgi:chemotaxis protein histidine kinase CheA
MAKLTPAQISKVTQWVADGASLSAVQGKLSSELGVSMTFLDVRFLVDDLNLTLQEKEEPKKVEEPAVEEAAPAAEAAASVAPEAPADATAPAAASSVKVEIDPLARPGTMVSGTVTFSDGQLADWYIDMEGRPGVVPRVPGYRPTQPDIVDFQTKLDLVLRQAGY